MKKHKNHGRVIGTGERIFDAGMTILGILISIVVLYPIYYALIASLSKPLYVENGTVMFSIKHFTLESYKQACAKPGIWIAYANTIFYTHLFKSMFIRHQIKLFFTTITRNI